MAWSALDWTEQDRIRKAREAAGLDLNGLANASGITRHTLGRWEASRHAPSPATIAVVVRVLAERLEVTEADLTAWIRTGALP